MAKKSKSKKNQTAATSEILATADIKPPNPKEDALPLKDREEEELEKLVFGDLAGFKAGLRAHEEESEAEDEAGDSRVDGDLDAGKGGDLTALQDDEVSHCALIGFFFLPCLITSTAAVLHRCGRR